MTAFSAIKQVIAIGVSPFGLVSKEMKVAKIFRISLYLSNDKYYLVQIVHEKTGSTVP